MMSNKVGFDDHRSICDGKQKERVGEITELRETQLKMYGMIKEIHGYTKGKEGGSL